jgi:ArsR family transcriptional regulator, arsenate/arsenite/antimonite-responsive transcriptional repressor
LTILYVRYILNIDIYLYQYAASISGGNNMNNSDYVLAFKALADETRLSIVKLLTDGELCGCKILENFDITQPTLSYHMKALCDSGLVGVRRDGSWMRYSLNKDLFGNIRDMFEELCLADFSRQAECDCEENSST